MPFPRWFSALLAVAGAQPSYYDAGVSACVVGGGFDHFPFCNVSLPLDARVHDLVSRIPVEAKANLLTARGHLKNRGRQALPELGVPSYYWGSNCLHSAMSANCTAAGRCSTSFPSGPSWSATFDRELMRSMAGVVGRETRAFFNMGNFTDNGKNGMGLDCWGPVLNINRDPRWGRHGEGGTEDPFLMGQLGLAWTKGLQEGEDKRFIQVAVTLKHFDANSLEGGAEADQGYDRHDFSATISKYLLADYYWPAFKAPIREGKAKGVMCSYNAAEASCLAVKNGQCDIDSGNTYYDNLLQGVQEGHCSMQDVDRALFNTLRVRFELGLFDPTADQPYWKLGAGDIGTDNAKELNLEAAQASLVLLSNPGILPLKGGQRLALLGPHAAASMDLIQVDTGRVCPGDTGDDENFWCVKTPYAAIQSLNAAKNGSTVYVKGCNLSEAIPGGLQQAISAAKASEVVVLGLGISERPEISDNFLEREAHDRDSIDLPNVQKQLAAEIIGLGKPTIVFLLNGGMVAVEEFLNKNNVAVIEAFYPGMEGATALAQSIFGLANKWGRMPYTVYRSDWPNHNSMIDHDVTHQRTYRYGADAVVPFGFGLSLSRFSLSLTPTLNADLRPVVLSSTVTSNVTFTVVARNLGSLMGDAVVMAYFHPKQVALPLHPQKSLFDFARASRVRRTSQLDPRPM